MFISLIVKEACVVFEIEGFHNQSNQLIKLKIFANLFKNKYFKTIQIRICQVCKKGSSSVFEEFSFYKMNFIRVNGTFTK